jgi:hypothetical protein
MRFIHIALTTVFVLGGGAAGGADWVEAQSLRELPAGIQVLLGVGLAPREGGIADRGEAFNATDTIIAGVNDGLPHRRFSLGLLDGGTALVAQERGGLGHTFDAVKYRRIGDAWEAVRCVSMWSPPQRPADLLDAFAQAGERQPVPCSQFRKIPRLAPGRPGKVVETAVRPRPGA